MGRKIFDEFTNIPCGRRRYVLRNKARKLCPRCPNFAEKGLVQCAKHNALNRKSSAKYRVINQVLNSLGKD